MSFLGHIHLLLDKFYEVTHVGFSIEIFLAVIYSLFFDLVHVAAPSPLLQNLIDLSNCHSSVDATVNELLLVFGM